jgi:hypothetical protein
MVGIKMRIEDLKITALVGSIPRPESRRLRPPVWNWATILAISGRQACGGRST